MFASESCSTKMIRYAEIGLNKNAQLWGIEWDVRKNSGVVGWSVDLCSQTARCNLITNYYFQLNDFSGSDTKKREYFEINKQQPNEACQIGKFNAYIYTCVHMHMIFEIPNVHLSFDTMPMHTHKYINTRMCDWINTFYFVSIGGECLAARSLYQTNIMYQCGNIVKS